MKNLVIVCLLFSAGIIGFSSCEKIEKDTPKAIKKLIRDRSKRENGQVVEYEYNNENIYKWWYPLECTHPDAYYYDKNANLLWQSGGFDGMGQGIPLEGFYEKAICKRIIWTSKTIKEYL